MTQNQIAYWNLQEAKRANRAKELESVRSNLAKEQEAQRSNLAKEAETNRANLASESVSRAKVRVDNMLGTVRNVETERHNKATEALQGAGLVADVTKGLPGKGTTLIAPSDIPTGRSKQDLDSGLSLLGPKIAAGMATAGTSFYFVPEDIKQQLYDDLLHATNAERTRRAEKAGVFKNVIKPSSVGATIGVIKPVKIKAN